MSKEKVKGYSLLENNHVGELSLKTGDSTKYGVIRLTSEYLVYFTAKGLREIWKQEMNNEEKKRAQELKNIMAQEGGEEILIQSEHIAITHFEDIDHVIS